MIVAFCAAWTLASQAFAEIPHYRHTAIPSTYAGSTDGSQIMAEDRRGFLWSAFGYPVAFDGRHFERVQNASIEDNDFLSVFSTRAGDLWWRVGRGGVFRSKDGRFVPVKALGTVFVLQFLEDRSGRVLVYYRDEKTFHLARLDHGRWTDIVSRLPLQPKGHGALDASFAASAFDSRIWALIDGRVGYADPDSGRKGLEPFSIRPKSRVLECPGNQVILIDSKEVRAFAADDARPTIRTLYRFPKPIPAPVATIDIRNQIWIAAATLGVVRLRCPAASTETRSFDNQPALFDARDLGGSLITGIFADRTGNIWVATGRGLDRFNYVDVATPLSAPSLYHDARKSNRDFGVATGSRGEIYAAAGDKLYRIDPWGDPVEIDDLILTREAFCPSSKGGVWIVSGRSITRIDGEKRYHRKLSPRLPEGFNCVEDGDGNLVFSAALHSYSFDGARVSEVAMKPHQWSFYAVGPGPGGSALGYVGNGLLYKIKNGVATPLLGTDEDKVPFIAAIGGAGEFAYLTTMNAPVRFDGTRFDFRERGTGPAIVDVSFREPDGTGWSFVGHHLNRIPAGAFDKMFTRPGYDPPHRIFDEADGLQGVMDGDGKYGFALGGDGRLWISTTEGVSYIDTKSFYHNPVPPPVFITGFKADGKDQSITASASAIDLPAGTSYFKFAYSAVNLSDFDRSRFKVKLEGFDKDWVDVGNQTGVTYTALPPGHYVFRVIASNESGVWNTSGASLVFDLPPTFLQSIWFKLIIAAILLILLIAAYLYRTRQIVRRVRSRLLERADERERIARDLHDTFLQAVQGLMLRFEAVAQRLPPQDERRTAMNAALEQADEVIFEGRDRVRGLRSRPGREQLAAYLQDIARTSLHGSTIELAVETNGKAREIQDAVIDELGQITREFAANTLRHADADSVTIEVTYRWRSLIVSWRDDGRGIPSEILQHGIDGHFGLSGMRERAAAIRAKFELTSGGNGCAAHIVVPAAMAYADRWWADLLIWQRPSAGLG